MILLLRSAVMVAAHVSKTIYKGYLVRPFRGRG